MRSRSVVFTVLTVILVAEYYSYMVVRSAVRNLPSPWRTILTALYIAFTVLTWASFIFFRRIE